jgi:hypothetical protein
VRVAIYRRISTDEERQSFSLDAQQERLAAYIAVQPGWVLTRSYSDRMSVSALTGQACNSPCRTPGPAAMTCCWCSRSTGWPARREGWPRCWRSWTKAGSRSALLPSRSTPPPPRAA